MPTYQKHKKNIVFNLSDIKTNLFLTKNISLYLDVYHRFEKIYPINYHRHSDTLKLLDSIFIKEAVLRVSENNHNMIILNAPSLEKQFDRVALARARAFCAYKSNVVTPPVVTPPVVTPPVVRQNAFDRREHVIHALAQRRLLEDEQLGLGNQIEAL